MHNFCPLLEKDVPRHSLCDTCAKCRGRFMSSIEGYTMDPFAVAVRSFDRALSGRARQTAGALARAEAGLADARARLCVACLLPSPVSAPSPCGSGEDRHGPHAERGPCRHCALARARTLGIPDAGSQGWSHAQCTCERSCHRRFSAVLFSVPRRIHRRCRTGQPGAGAPAPPRGVSLTSSGLSALSRRGPGPWSG